MRGYLWILCLTPLFITCNSTPVRSIQQSQDQNRKLDWSNFDWTKKAPCERRPPTPDQNEKNFASPRRASAPHRSEEKRGSKGLAERPIHHIQARRHNSAPMLRLQIEPAIIIANALPKTPDVTRSPPAPTLSMEPLDYFDPRFSTTSTPEELKQQGITKTAAEKMVLRRQSKEEESLIEHNFRDGLLTCSLCLDTFTYVGDLQSHLQVHF